MHPEICHKFTNLLTYDIYVDISPLVTTKSREVISKFHKLSQSILAFINKAFHDNNVKMLI